MSDCKNTYRGKHACDPFFTKRYDGYCLDCANAGVAEMTDAIAVLESVNAKLAAELEAIREAWLPFADRIKDHFYDRASDYDPADLLEDTAEYLGLAKAINVARTEPDGAEGKQCDEF